jgi:hypothetical protein
LRSRLSKHLSTLKRQRLIDEWHDGRISPGEKFDKAIADQIEDARVILLLISADSLHSDYCYEIEMKRALERHEKGEAVVIPVILRPCVWEIAPFGKLQALPKDGRPVTSWPNQDEAFADVAAGIRRTIEEQRISPHREAASGARPDMGDLVFRRCDRGKHISDFEIFLNRHHHSQALVCGIPGEELECHHSLGKRLTEECIRRFALRKWGPLDGVVAAEFVRWPDSGVLAARKERFINDICVKLGCGADEPSAEAVIQAVNGRLEKIIVLSHELRMQKWGDDEREMLRWYLSFWDEVSDGRPSPKFVILLNLVYPSRTGRSRLFQGRRHKHDKIKPELHNMFSAGRGPSSRLLLEVLNCITYEDVKNWFVESNIFDEGEWLVRCKELFKQNNCRPMVEIEKELKRYHHEFILQRG